MAKHARTQVAAPGMHVYQVASSTVNPLVFRDVFRFVFHHFSRSPVIDAAGQPIPVQPMRFCDSMEQYASNAETNTTLTRWARRPASAERLRKAVIAQIMHLGRIYEPYTFYGGRFAEMSEEERARFHSDVRSVDWEDYLINVHVPGVRKHVMKARGSSP
jgi:fatty acyl-CoA reductase